LRKILTFITLLILLLPSSTQAQEQVTLSSLDVNLWPEFDHPSMLVIYFATLSPEVSLPVELTFRMPASVDTPHAVAEGPSTTAVGDVFYSRQVSGDWTYITFTATMPVIQFEYYDPDLLKQEDQRHFEYRWTGDYAVESFSLRVQQPVDASDFRISPAISNMLQGGDGLLYHNLEVGALQSGDTFQVSLDYTKDSDRLTYESLQIQPSGSIPSEPTSPVLVQILPWVLGTLGIILIAGAGFWYWNSTRHEATPPARTRRRSTRNEEDDVVEAGSIYCHQCGKRAHSTDRFCRSCGARLRKE
jgi:hypothetical protein